MATRLPIGISKAHLIVWDTFILANIVFILLYIFKRLPSYLALFFVFLTALILNLWSIYMTPLVTLLFLIGEFINLDPGDALQYLTAAIEYSLQEQIARIFYQPPELNVTVQSASGEAKSFRAIKSIVNGEVLANKFVYSFDSIEAYFKSKGKLSEQVKRIKFDTPQQWGIQPNFSYQIKSVTLNSPS